MAMAVAIVVTEITNTATESAPMYMAARKASSTARKPPAAAMDTTTETAMAFVAAATTKKTTIRRPVSTTSATDPTCKLRITAHTACNRLERTAQHARCDHANRRRRRGVRVSCWPPALCSGRSDSPTRRGENGARRPAWSTPRGPAPGSRTPRAAMVRRRARSSPRAATAVPAGRRRRRRLVAARALRARRADPGTRLRRGWTVRRTRWRKPRRRRRRARPSPLPRGRRSDRVKRAR